MAASSPSPSTSPLADPPASTATPPPQSSTPTPNPTSGIHANPPESSTIPSPPTPVTSPPPVSPPPPGATPPTVTSPPPSPPSPPPAPATSPLPPTNPTPSPDTPPPSPPASPLPTAPVSPSPPTEVTPPPTSPPPPSIPPSSPATNPPSVPSPPSSPPSSPPPPATEPKSPPTSTSRSPHHSPSPTASASQPPESPPPPPPVSQATYPPPPPSASPSRKPPSAPQSPESSPSSPAQETPSASPPQDSPASPSAQISPSVSHLSPPPVSPPIAGSELTPSSATPSLGNSTADSPSNAGVPVGGVVAIGVAVGVIMLGLIGIVVLYMSKRKRRTSQHSGGYILPSPYGSSPRSDSNLIIKTAVSTPFVRSGSASGTLSPSSHGGLGHSRSWFTYQELFEATNGFALDNFLGEGGFGTVYKGILANGREVAVKQLKIGGGQGEREFRAEVETISRIHHRHLVSLVGYCIYDSRRLLVYDYVPNRTLYYHLHGENRPVMDWATRIKIAEGAARGIAYLHEDCHPRIIHRDIKSSNILLDNKFEARVSDFGLAKALDAGTHVSTRVMGTFGYMAPEYATSGKLTEKSDVYSFGVVLLELITGRKPVDASQPLGDESLVEWAKPLLGHALDTGQTEGLVDPRLENNYVESELFLMIEAAAACVRHSATKRPRMGQVVRAFDSLSPSDLCNGMRVGQSEIYESAQQSAEIRLFRRMAFGSQDSTDFFVEATRNMAYSNPNQTDQGAVFSTQQRRNALSQQPSQNIYFSRHRIQNPNISAESSLNRILPHQRSQNPAFSGHSSQNLVSSGQSSLNVDSSSRESRSS